MLSRGHVHRIYHEFVRGKAPSVAHQYVPLEVYELYEDIETADCVHCNRPFLECEEDPCPMRTF